MEGIVICPTSPTSDIDGMESQKAMHSQYVLQLLQLQRRSGFLCDITIYVQDKSFKAHKPLLAACSLYFRSIFSDIENSQTSALNLSSLTPAGFEILLNYIYSGSLAITFDNSKEVLSAATCLQMTNVVETCVNFIRSSFTKAPYNINKPAKSPSYSPRVVVSPIKQKSAQCQPPMKAKTLLEVPPVSTYQLQSQFPASNISMNGVKTLMNSTMSIVNGSKVIGLQKSTDNLSTDELNRIMPYLVAKNARRPTLQEVTQLLVRNAHSKNTSTTSGAPQTYTTAATMANSLSPTSRYSRQPPPLYDDGAITDRSTDCPGVNKQTPEQTSGLTKDHLEKEYLRKDCTVLIESDGESDQHMRPKEIENRNRNGWNDDRSVVSETDLSGTPYVTTPSVTPPATTSPRTTATSDSEILATSTQKPSSVQRSISLNAVNDRISAETANSAVEALFCGKHKTSHDQHATANKISKDDVRHNEETDMMSSQDDAVEQEITCKQEPADDNPVWQDNQDSCTGSDRSTLLSPTASACSEEQALDLSVKTNQPNPIQQLSTINDVKKKSKPSNVTSGNQQKINSNYDESVNPEIATTQQSLNGMAAHIVQQQYTNTNGFSRPQQITFSRKPRRTSGGQTCPWPGCGRLFRHKNIYEEHQKLHEMGVPVSQLRKCYMGARVKKTVRERLEEMRTTASAPDTEDEVEKDDKRKRKKPIPLKKRRVSAPTDGYERKRVSPKDRLDVSQLGSTSTWLPSQPTRKQFMRSGSDNGDYQTVTTWQHHTPASNKNHLGVENSHQHFSPSEEAGNTSAVAATLAALGIQRPRRPSDEPIVSPFVVPASLDHSKDAQLNLDQLRRRLALRGSSGLSLTGDPMAPMLHPTPESTENHHPASGNGSRV